MTIFHSERFLENKKSLLFSLVEIFHKADQNNKFLVIKWTPAQLTSPHTDLFLKFEVGLLKLALRKFTIVLAVSSKFINELFHYYISSKN